MYVSSLLIVTSSYSLHGVVDYSLRGMRGSRTESLPLKSLAYFNKYGLYVAAGNSNSVATSRVYRERVYMYVYASVQN